jgi:predicted dehydrogenase
MLKVAVVGAGSIGREYALCHLIEELGVSVTAVVDMQLGLATSLARDVAYRRAGAKVVGSKYRETVQDDAHLLFSDDKLPTVVVATSLAEVINDVDICYVASPPSTHAAVAVLALQAGKHVLLEKPIAVTTEDTDAIIGAAENAWEKYGSIVNINIGMRYSDAAIEMKRLIDSGYLSDIDHFRLRLLFRQWPREWQVQPWVAGRQQGGPLLEVGTHWIFGLLEIVGHDNIHAVSCKSTYPDGSSGTQCESQCVGHIELKSGVRVAVDVQTTSLEAISAQKDIYELQAHGKNGESLIFYDFVVLKDGKTNQNLLSGKYGRRECISELVAAIRAKDRNVGNLVTPIQARNVQRIIEMLRDIPV